MGPKMMCLIVMSSDDISDISKKELEKAITALKRLRNWEIDKVTLMEDQRELE